MNQQQQQQGSSTDDASHAAFLQMLRSMPACDNITFDTFAAGVWALRRTCQQRSGPAAVTVLLLLLRAWQGTLQAYCLCVSCTAAEPTQTARRRHTSCASHGCGSCSPQHLAQHPSQTCCCGLVPKPCPAPSSSTSCSWTPGCCRHTCAPATTSPCNPPAPAAAQQRLHTPPQLMLAAWQHCCCCQRLPLGPAASVACQLCLQSAAAPLMHGYCS